MVSWNTYHASVVLTASKPRANIYRVLDQVLATGEPVVIERNGRRLSRLVNRTDVVTGDSADLVHLDWSGSGNEIRSRTDA